MAQRASVFAKRPAGGETGGTDVLPRSADQANAEPQSISLELAPLLAPYRKHGRLALRVERLPRHARLTNGHNNGDRSWSLKSDELDGLAYLPPKGGEDHPVLAIRIISLDGGDGATLALLDYPIGGGACAPLAARDPASDGELRRLRDELADLKAALSQRESELAGARQAFECELAAARTNANVELEERLCQATAALEARWRQQSAQALADARDGGEAALQRLRDDFAEAQTQLAQRDMELLQAYSAAERAREQALKHVESVLSTAQQTAVADAERLREEETELRGLRDKIALLQGTLAEGERALARTRSEFEQERAHWKQQTETALATAQKAWNAGETARLAAAQAKGQEESAAELAELTRQLKRTQTELAQACAETEVLRHRGDAADFHDLREEFEALQATLAERESELAWLRSDTQPQRAHWTDEARITLHKADRLWTEENAQAMERKHRHKAARRLVRDVALAASLAALATVFYLRGGLTGEESWWPQFASLTAWIDPFSGSADAPAAAVSPTPAPAGPRPMAVVLRTANVRVGPSTAAAVIATLPPDAEVGSVGRQGNWVRVRLDAADGAHRQREGWVYRSFLKDAAGARDKPAAPRDR